MLSSSYPLVIPNSVTLSQKVRSKISGSMTQSQVSVYVVSGEDRGCNTTSFGNHIATGGGNVTATSWQHHGNLTHHTARFPGIVVRAFADTTSFMDYNS